MTRSGKLENPLDVVLAASSLILGLFAVATMVAVGYLDYSRLPWFDAWAYWTEYLNAGNPLTVLFDRMNEHRIVITRLLYLADMAWFSADTRLLLWSSYAVQFGSAALLYRMTTTSFELSPANRVYAAGLILTFAFAAPQWINFTWTFLTCFLMVPFAAMGGFILLAKSVQDGSNNHSASWRLVVASLAMGLIATGSMSNGLVVWPLLVAMAATLRLPKVVIAGIAAFGAVVFLAYMSGAPTAQASISKSLTRPWTLAPFALAYLGSAFDEPMLLVGSMLGRDWEAYRVPATVLAGSIGLAWAAYLFLDAARKLPSMSRNRIAMLYTIAFFVGSSGLIALGRAQYPLHYALAPRYVTASLLFWACLLLIATSAAATTRHPGAKFRRHGIPVAALCIAGFVGGLPQLPKVAYAADTERYVAEGEYALINGVFAVDAWSRFYSAPGEMIATVRFFREQDLSMFTQEWAGWIGHYVGAHYAIANPSYCVGAWESLTPLGGSYTPAVIAGGWALDRQFGRAPDLIVFTDASRRIVGYTSGTRRRPDVQPSLDHDPSHRVGWIAYLPAGLPADLTAYALLGDERSLCEVGEAHLPGTYLTAGFGDAGPVIPGLNVAAQGGWTRGESVPPTESAPSPTESWSSSTVKSGDAALWIGPVSCSSGSSIGLPLITSTASSTIRVSVVERGTGNVLAAAHPPPGLTDWDLWRLDVPVGGPAMTCDYIVEDDDNDPATWIAVGLPRTIRPPD